jgi:hypothetical protein
MGGLLKMENEISVTFEYWGKDQKKGFTLFKAYQGKYVHGYFSKIEDSKEWEIVIPSPYKFGHWFWELERHDPTVIEKSLKLAKKYNAPEWVFER